MGFWLSIMAIAVIGCQSAHTIMPVAPATINLSRQAHKPHPGSLCKGTTVRPFTILCLGLQHPQQPFHGDWQCRATSRLAGMSAASHLDCMAKVQQCQSRPTGPWTGSHMGVCRKGCRRTPLCKLAADQRGLPENVCKVLSCLWVNWPFADWLQEERVSGG